MKKILALLVVFTLVASFVPSGTRIVEAFSGLGTEINPYVLQSYEDLKLLSENISSYSNNNFVLANDITIPPNTTWTSIGTSNNKFSGTFDGKGHKVNFNNNPSVNGFFGFVNGGTIRRLAVTNADVQVNGSVEKVGILAGSLTGESNVENCYVTGKISATVTAGSYVGCFIGAVAGSNNGNGKANIVNCYADVNIIKGNPDLTGNIKGFVGNWDKYYQTKNYYTDSAHPDGDRTNHATLLTSSEKGKMLPFNNLNDNYYPADDVWKIRSNNYPDLKTYVKLQLDPNYDNSDVILNPIGEIRNANSFAYDFIETGISIRDWPESSNLTGDKNIAINPNQDFDGWYSEPSCINRVETVPTYDTTLYGKWKGSPGVVDTYSFCATQPIESKEMGVVLDSTYYYPAIVRVDGSGNYTFFTQGKYTIVFTGIQTSTKLSTGKHELNAYWVNKVTNTLNLEDSRTEIFYKGGGN